MTVLQPTVRPLYDTRSVHELAKLLEGSADGLAIVRQTWQPMLEAGAADPAAQEDRWQGFLRAGFIPETAPSARTPALVGQAPAPNPAEAGGDGIEIVFRPDPCVWDGRFANCAWLQELPKPLTKLTWDTVAALSPSLATAQRNPDVTVRARGGMEKCTYCIQRIAAVGRQARVENRPIGDGEVVPACQQACPTPAIMFGNAADPDSRVSLWKQSSRDYGLLEHLGTRPRTTYLARVTTGEHPGER